jgi:hypothetical protein
VALTWLAPNAGDAPIAYIVEAGSVSGASNITTFDTGTTRTSLTVLGVPAGTYYVRLRARNDAGMSAPSNEIVVTVGSTVCGTTPSAASGLTGSVNGSTVSLTWNAPGGGCPPTNYFLEAGSSPGASNIVNFSTGSDATSFTTTGVPPATYYVRVRASNANGTSAPSNEVLVTVSGGSGGSLAGHWVGLAPDGLLIPNSGSCNAEQDITADFAQTGTSFSGPMTGRVRRLWVPGCDTIGATSTSQVSGSASAGTFTLTLPGDRGRFITFSGTYTATRLSGTTADGSSLILNRQ